MVLAISIILYLFVEALFFHSQEDKCNVSILRIPRAFSL
jgi:hypothetical protein